MSNLNTLLASNLYTNLLYELQERVKHDKINIHQKRLRKVIKVYPRISRNQ